MQDSDRKHIWNRVWDWLPAPSELVMLECSIDGAVPLKTAIKLYKTMSHVYEFIDYADYSFDTSLLKFVPTKYSPPAPRSAYRRRPAGQHFLFLEHLKYETRIDYSSGNQHVQFVTDYGELRMLENIAAFDFEQDHCYVMIVDHVTDYRLCILDVIYDTTEGICL